MAFLQFALTNITENSLLKNTTDFQRKVVTVCLHIPFHRKTEVWVLQQGYMKGALSPIFFSYCLILRTIGGWFPIFYKMQDTVPPVKLEKLKLGVPHGWQEYKYLSHQPVPSKVYFNHSWNKEQSQNSNPSTVIRNAGAPSGFLAVEPNADPIIRFLIVKSKHCSYKEWSVLMSSIFVRYNSREKD